MNSYSHFEDLAKVNCVNAIAMLVSLTDFEQSIRVFSCLAAGIYTVVKIIQTIQQIKNKNDE